MAQIRLMCMRPLGRSICQECYEVSEDVILEFKKSFAPEHWEKLFYREGKRKISVKSLGSK